MLFKLKVLRRINGPTHAMDRIGEVVKNQELYTLFTDPDIMYPNILIIKLDRLLWAGHLARMSS